MALQQTKETKIHITKKTITKEDLAIELNVSKATINEYILGDKNPPNNVEIIPTKNGMVEVKYKEELIVPKYEGVFYNELKNGDKTFYIIYTDLKTNKKVNLKIGKESNGITEKYCENKRTEILNEMRLGETQNKIKNRRILKELTTFDKVAQAYYENRKLHMKEKNHKDAVSKYEKHIKPYLGDIGINEITVEDIEKIMIDKKGNLANRTINIIIEKISTIFNFGIKKKLFKGHNPVIEIEKLSDKNERDRFLSKEEINTLLNELKSNEYLYIFTYIALMTGGRLEALCKIKVKDIDFNHLLINLIDDKGEDYYKTFLKNDQNFISLLKNFLKDLSPNDYIFGKEKGSVVAISRYFQRELSKVFDKLFNQSINELPINEDKEIEAEKRRHKVVIHTLRHTFASQLAINGTPIFTIQQLMNHKDIKMTLRYAKLCDNSGRENVDCLF